MKSAFRPQSSILGLLGVLSFASTPCALAQASDLQVNRDMEFARELATRFAYVDLAEEVLADLDSRNLAGPEAEALDLLRCDVYAAGARGGRTVEDRIRQYDKALDSFKGFLKKNKFSDHIPTAQKNYVNLVNAYGRLLEIELQDALGTQAEEYRTKILEVVGDGLELTSELISDTKGASSQVERNERYRLMLNAGQMYLTVATISEDGTYEFGRAEQILERVAGEAGETSAAGLTAFILLAKVQAAQNQHDLATDFAGFVLSTLLPEEDQKAAFGWDDLSFEEKSQRWKLGEQAARIVIDAWVALGNAEESCKWSLHIYNYWKSEGFEISPLGHLALLSAARALMDSAGFVGGALNSGELEWFADADAMAKANFKGSRNSRSALDLALGIAQEVNDKNKGNTLQWKAQKLISGIIERPGVDVSPEILLQAAEGDYYAGDYIRAIDSFKSIMRSLESRDEATQREHAPKALFFIGKAHAQLGRHLEAAMAYREAGTTWGGDLNYQSDISDGFYREAAIAKREAGGDPLLHALVLEAENLQSQSNRDAGGAISYRQGERLFYDKKYREARTKYLQVETSDTVYEKALVKAALCLYHTRDLANSQVEFKRFIEQYAADPRNKPVDKKAKKVRTEALAVATYYLGAMAYDAERFREAVNYLGGYHKTFPSQDSYGPRALYKVVRAHIASAELNEAKSVCAEMQASYAQSAETGAAAGQVYRAVDAMYAEAQAAGVDGRANELLHELATYMHLANELDTTPNYGNLRKESSHWIKLEQWVDAERTLRKIVKYFADDPDPKKDVQRHALPDLGLALMMQQRLPEAYQVLDPLIDKTPDSKANTSTLLLRWSRAVSGWVDGDEDEWIEVPGVGGAEDLALAAGFLRRLTDMEKARTGAYEAKWYGLKFDTAYVYYQWGKEDSAQSQNAKALIENLKQRTGDQRLKDVAVKTGDDVLRNRFLQLADKLR